MWQLKFLYKCLKYSHDTYITLLHNRINVINFMRGGRTCRRKLSKEEHNIMWNKSKWVRRVVGEVYPSEEWMPSTSHNSVPFCFCCFCLLFCFFGGSQGTIFVAIYIYAIYCHYFLPQPCHLCIREKIYVPTPTLVALHSLLFTPI